MHRILQSEKSIPLLFAILTLLGYGLLIGTAGFHWDDWGFAWAARFLGPGQFIASFKGFRPFLGPIFFITTSLIPSVPLYWQMFALLMRFCLGISAWWALKSFWPERARFALVVGLFVLVFPGYSQHWVALTHTNQEIIPFVFYLLSFGVSAHAIRRGSLWFTIPALLFQFWGLFPTEYFWGLEPLRFLFIYSVLQEDGIFNSLRRALAIWLPYLLVWLADGLWLAMLYRSQTYISYGIDTSRDFNLMNWIAGLVDALLKAGIIAWVQIIKLAGSSLPSPTSLLTLGLILASFAMLLFYFLRFPRQEPVPSIAGIAILAGLIGILLGRVPSLAVGLPLTLQSVFDRFMISMSLGASLLAAGLLEWLFRRKERAKWVVISLLIALAIGQQFFNANLFRRDWARQQEIFWQLTWRIPALEPNTLLLTSVVPDMPLETDLSFTAPINWIYAPGYRGGDLPYALLYTEARLGGGAIAGLEPHQDINLPFRTVTFHGSTDSVLVFLVPVNGCLRILDPGLNDQDTYQKESKFLTQAIALSDPRRIRADAPPATLPVPPFTDEPVHTWCYFYEKAELARQTGDWQAVASIGREALTRNYRPQDPLEWLPFIEAHARNEDIQGAISMSQAVFKDSARTRKGLCNLWGSMSDIPGTAAASAYIREELNCTP